MAVQPRCPNCGVLMRDVPQGWPYPAWGHIESAETGDVTSDFDVPKIYGGRRMTHQQSARAGGHVHGLG